MDALKNARRIMVKVGSALLVDERRRLRRAWLDALAADIGAWRGEGRQLLVVSSGAIALGRGALGLKRGRLRLDESQAAAAMGQIVLAQAWRQALARHGAPTAQLLLTPADTEDRRSYLNARNTLATLLRHDVVPVINENDTVTTEEDPLRRPMTAWRPAWRRWPGPTCWCCCRMWTGSTAPIRRWTRRRRISRGSMR